MGEIARPQLLQRIQVDWTEGQRLHWAVNKEYLRPYKNVADAVSNRYTEEQQAIINRYRSADPPEKQRLRDIEVAEGEGYYFGDRLILSEPPKLGLSITI